MRKHPVFVLGLLLAAHAHAGDPSHPRHNACRQWDQPPAQGTTPPSHDAEGFRYIADCSRGNTWQRVDANAQSKKFLQTMSAAVKADSSIPRPADWVLRVNSCFRSQASQNYILCLNECESPFPNLVPSFGNKQCSGRVAATLSEHTIGTASDYILPSRITDSVPQQANQRGAWYARQDQELKRACQLVAKVRQLAAGGRGGITIYGAENGQAWAHYDVKPDWCNWGACEKILGEGHCKRLKYRMYEARLLKDQQAAQLRNDRAAVARLQAELNKLRGDCKPGDNSCRDNFKDPTLPQG